MIRFFLLAVNFQSEPMLDRAKQNMIQSQLMTFDVFDPSILQVMSQIPREKFVPKDFQQLAYADISLPIGHGQWMMPPKETARILQALNIKKNEKILLWGVESGYLAALLSQLGKEVYVLDKSAELVENAKQKLQDSAIKNVIFLPDNKSVNLEKFGPFQVIFISGSVPVLPNNLQKNLGRNGRIFVIIGTSAAMAANVLQRLSTQQWETTTLFETKHPALPNYETSEKFIF